MKTVYTIYWPAHPGRDCLASWEDDDGACVVELAGPNSSTMITFSASRNTQSEALWMLDLDEAMGYAFGS